MKVEKAEKLKNGYEAVSGTLTENEAKAIMEITGTKDLNEAIKKYMDICTAKVGENGQKVKSSRPCSR